MDVRAALRAEKEKYWQSLSVAERIRQTILEQEAIDRSLIVGAGLRIANIARQESLPAGADGVENPCNQARIMEAVSELDDGAQPTRSSSPEQTRAELDKRC